MFNIYWLLVIEIAKFILSNIIIRNEWRCDVTLALSIIKEHCILKYWTYKLYLWNLFVLLYFFVWSLCCLLFFDIRILITPLVSSISFSDNSGSVSSSYSTSDTRRVNLVTNPVISHEWGKDRDVLVTNGTYSWSFVTQIFHNGQPSHGGDRKTLSKLTVLGG
jgi:hypothetical protein